MLFLSEFLPQMLLCSLLQLLIIWYKFFHFIFIQCFCSKVEHKSLFLRDLIYFHYFVVFNRQNAWFQAISDGQNFYCYIIQISQIAVFLFLFPYSTATNTWSSLWQAAVSCWLVLPSFPCCQDCFNRWTAFLKKLQRQSMTFLCRLSRAAYLQCSTT